jgi:superfamily II DNA/RNA helicase
MPPTERYEQYIHRIGRVGRVGTDDGHAFVFFDPELPNDEMLAEFLYKVFLLHLN